VKASDHSFTHLWPSLLGLDRQVLVRSDILRTSGLQNDSDIESEAVANCRRRSDEFQAGRPVSIRAETVKTVPLVISLGHGAKASMAMPDAPGGRVLPVLVALATVALASCRPDMANQPRAKPLSESDFFSNRTSAQPPPAHAIARGRTRNNPAFFTGLTNGCYVTQLPVQLTPALLARGRERFDTICAVCHDRTGSGNGMVVQRGFPQPPSFHVDRLRNAPIGHFYDVITNGYGVMYPYADRVEPEDRWAIAAYIRALQLSHNAKLPDVDPRDRAILEASQ
jgi:mono/diheme cytochrome c family protein